MINFLGEGGDFQSTSSLVLVCKSLWQHEGGDKLGAGGQWGYCLLYYQLLISFCTDVVRMPLLVKKTRMMS